MLYMYMYIILCTLLRYMNELVGHEENDSSSKKYRRSEREESKTRNKYDKVQTYERAHIYERAQTYESVNVSASTIFAPQLN